MRNLAFLGIVFALLLGINAAFQVPVAWYDKPDDNTTVKAANTTSENITVNVTINETIWNVNYTNETNATAWFEEIPLADNYTGSNVTNVIGNITGGNKTASVSRVERRGRRHGRHGRHGRRGHGRKLEEEEGDNYTGNITIVNSTAWYEEEIPMADSNYTGSNVTNIIGNITGGNSTAGAARVEYRRRRHGHRGHGHRGRHGGRGRHLEEEEVPVANQSSNYTGNITIINSTAWYEETPMADNYTGSNVTNIIGNITGGNATAGAVEVEYREELGRGRHGRHGGHRGHRGHGIRGGHGRRGRNLLEEAEEDNAGGV